MFITKKHISRRTFLRGTGGAIVALPFLDSMVPAQTPLQEHGREPEDAVRLLLRAARRDDGQVDAGDGRQRLRVHRDPEAARAVPRAGERDQRPGASVCRRCGRRGCLGGRQSHPRGGGVPDRRGSRARSARASRRVGGPGGGEAHRTGHSAAVARAVDRRSRARLRGVVQLRLPQLDLVEVADRSAADAEQPSAGVREAVRRRRDRRRAPRAAAGIAKPARFGDGTGRDAAERSAGGRPAASDAVSRRCARGRAADSAGRGQRARGPDAARDAERRAGHVPGSPEAADGPAGDRACRRRSPASRR